MPRVAALYDIHGNLPALDAVLGDVERLDPDVVVIGGDVVWGPWPQETMDRLLGLDRDVRFIMGNADRDVFDRTEGDWKVSNDWCADRLTREHLDFLRTSPATIAIDDVLFCHGSPRSDLDPMTVGTPDDQILEWCSGVTERAIVCGHTHAQFDRAVSGFRIVNAGSVGEPFEGFGACWATFDPAPELQFTPYDVHATADAIRATGFPYAEIMAANITSRLTADDAARWFSGRAT